MQSSLLSALGDCHTHKCFDLKIKINGLFYQYGSVFPQSPGGGVLVAFTT